MLRKIAKWITNNLGLKILAAVLAVFIWMVILNIEDPDKTKVYTAEVTIVNEEYLTEMGKTYEVLNNSDTITFTATARRSIIEEIDESNFEVTADLEDIVNMSEVPIEIKATRYSGSVDISEKTQYVELNVEDLVTEEIEIAAQTTGEMTESYSVSGLETDPETVLVEGPESVVEQIASAVATVDVSSETNDFSAESEIVLYDEESNEVSQDRLTLSCSSVTVTADVVQTKTVELVYTVSGSPPDDYQITGVSGSLTEAVVQGDPDVVGGIDSIEISGEALSADSLTETAEIEIDLNSYLPAGVTLASPDDAAVTVTIEIEGKEEVVFEIPVSNIELTGLPDGYECEVSDETVSVTLKGFSGELGDIDAADLTGTADLSGLTEGSHSVTVSIDGDYEVSGKPALTVTLTEAEEEEETEGTGQEEEEAESE